MSKQPIYRDFVSGIDAFFHQFDTDHPELSASQKLEIEKHNRIKFLRDVDIRPELKINIWEGF